jgi:hypothetical protein
MGRSMVGRVRHEPDALVVTFERDGEEPQTQLVIGSAADPGRAGERAMIYALGMLLRRGRLLAGDRLTVEAADESQDNG